MNMKIDLLTLPNAYLDVMYNYTIPTFINLFNQQFYLNVVAKIQAPCSTRNLTIGKLLHDAAQCKGVQPSESWAFTSHPNSTKNCTISYEYRR